ncbi:sugar ABC transporter ATP-binding protein [Mediterraneibacter gnavus]|uniref:sugar ABC transporter ATP-binding protein n=1 Tax=Mediterraneibacter gnavus TaxID=33038 RepID=UPI00374E5CA6
MEIEMRGINKSFGNNAVLNNAGFVLSTGEIHALMGENGAGKSTLMKILTGVYTKDAGQVIVDGQEVCYKNAREAEKAGIVFIHQELNVLFDLTVEENMFLGKEIKKKCGVCDKKAMRREVEKILKRLGVEIDPGQRMEELSVGQQQMVEIAKALMVNAKVIIMDEPTAALTQSETRVLFEAANALRERGVSIVYISHRMGEIFLNGKQIENKTPKQAMKNGIGFITEDRKVEGLMLEESIMKNISLANLKRISRHGVIQREKEKELVKKGIEELHIRCFGPQHECNNLSGGNQQKVVFAKWMYTNPKVLILDEPTRGVDIGAKKEIYSIINDLAAKGVAIIMVSSELPEVLGMSDRVMVVREGLVRGFLSKEEANQENIMILATGGNLNE